MIVCVLVYYNVYCISKLCTIRWSLRVEDKKNGSNEMKNLNIKLEHNAAEVWNYKKVR